MSRTTSHVGASSGASGSGAERRVWWPWRTPRELATKRFVVHAVRVNSPHCTTFLHPEVRQLPCVLCGGATAARRAPTGARESISPHGPWRG